MKKLNCKSSNEPQDYWRSYFVGYLEKPARKYATEKRGTWYANYFINMQGYSIIFSAETDVTDDRKSGA